MGLYTTLRQLIEDTRGKRTVVVGEPALDVYVHGTMAGIAPARLRLLITRESMLPGASAAIARMLSTVGAKVSFVGIAGNDQAGLTLRESLLSTGVDVALLFSDKAYSTPVITHIFSDDSINANPLLLLDGRPHKRLGESIHQLTAPAVVEAIVNSDILVMSADFSQGYPEVSSQLREVATDSNTRIVEIALAAVDSLFESNSDTNKLYTLPELQCLVQQVRDRGGNVVFTNGCFDILHAGHVRYLAAAAQQGDFFVVAINSDESVRKIKGPSRPVQDEQARATVLSSLECVDALVIFSSEDVRPLLEVIRPEVYVKGGDYTIDTINQPERRLVESYGGQIVLLPGVEGQSTTNIIRKIHEDDLH